MAKAKKHTATCIRLSVHELDLINEGLWELDDYLERMLGDHAEDYSSDELAAKRRKVVRTQKLMNKIRAELRRR